MFNKLGLTLWNTDGSLKNTYTILKDLSEVYPTLTAEQKAYVTEQIAGWLILACPCGNIRD